MAKLRTNRANLLYTTSKMAFTRFPRIRTSKIYITCSVDLSYPTTKNLEGLKFSVLAVFSSGMLTLDLHLVRDPSNMGYDTFAETCVPSTSVSSRCSVALP